MADHKISELLTEKDCYNILEQHAGDTVRIMKYEINKADSKVIGFLGDHFRLKISYQENLDGHLKEITFFVKSQPIFNAVQADYVRELGLFQKESLIYKNILPTLSAIAGNYFSPKCYLIKTECLVFEDLLLRNFRPSVHQYLTLEECESLVRCLAEFHCASIVYEELNSLNGQKFRLDDKFHEELRETCFNFIDGHPRNKWIKNSTKCIEDCIKLVPHLKNSNKVIEKLYSLAADDMKAYIAASETYRNVLTHCDLWKNNFMFSDQSECILFDYQLARYCPPAFDLMLTLFLNTTVDFVDKNLKNLLSLYYNTFSNMLLRYKFVPEKVFPKNSFLDSVEYVKLPALLQTVIYATTTHISPETSSYILNDPERYNEFTFTNRSKYIVKEFKNNELFRKQFLEMLVPLTDFLMERK